MRKFRYKNQNLRYFIELSYNGKTFHGWQIQPDAISVQECIEKALSVLLRAPHSIVGAGRTDAGVHAKFMVAHFESENHFDAEKLVFQLNSYLPGSIAIYKIYQVKAESHARFNATARAYEYQVVTFKNPFENTSSHLVKLPLDVAKMNLAAEKMLKYTNFKCFSKSKTDVKTYNCELYYAFWEKQDDRLVFKISANRFLRNMVRAIVGTLLEIGIGKMQVEDIDRIILSENRSEAGYSVPAKGLYLTEVLYPESVRL